MPSRRVMLALFVGACAIQLLGLYWPELPGEGGSSGFDKLAHAGMFGLVMATGVLAGIPTLPLAGVLVAHAVVSELIQGFLLPRRGGDPWDAVADVVGIAIGVGVARWLARRASRRASRRDERAHAGAGQALP